MASTLKIGDNIIVKNTLQKGVILNIENGLYKISGQNIPYWGFDLIKEKKMVVKKRNAAIKQNSAKRQIMIIIYGIISREYMAHNKTCTARFAGCAHRATSIHHRYKRTGFYLIMTNLFLPICGSCHRYATDHSKEAIQAGVSISRYTDVPVTFTKREQELLKKYNVPRTL